MEKKLTKSQQNKILKENMHQVIAEHILDKEDIEKNSGQLKFMTGLVTGRIVVMTVTKTGNLKKEFTVKKVERFFDSYILGNVEENLAFFDFEKNKEAFMWSHYKEYLDMTHPVIWKEEYGCPPYLLLQKIQSVMRGRLNAYHRLDAKEEQKKNEAFLGWMYSVALYEIFLVEFLKKIQAWDIEPDRVSKDMEILLQKLDEICAAKDKEEKNRIWEEAAVICSQCIDFMDKEDVYFKICLYFWDQLISLFAMLRVMVFAEYVSINLPLVNPRSSTDKTALKDSVVWAQILDDRNLFLVGDCRANRNYATMFKTFNELVQKNSLVGQAGKKSQTGNKLNAMEEIRDDRNDLVQYLDDIQKNRDDPDTWDRMRDLEKSLARPVFGALDGIWNISQEVQNRKKKYQRKTDGEEGVK